MKKCIWFILFILILFSIENLSAQKSERLTSRKIGKETAVGNERYTNFRFTLGGGYAYWLGKLMKTGNKQLDDFSSGLRNGYNLDLEAQYFFQEYIGIGLNGNFIKQSNHTSGVLDIPGLGSVDNYKESNELIHLGISCVVRFERDKWGFYTGLGLGPIFYTNTAEILGRQISLNKTTLAASCNIALERRFSRNLGAGMKAAVTSGTIKVNGLDDRLSVSNLIITGFISFRTK